MRTTYQSSSSYQAGSQNRNPAPQQPQQPTQPASRYGADFDAEKDFFLKYASIGNETIVSGSSDYGILLGLRDAILRLRSDYFGQSGSVVIKGDDRT